MLTKTEIYQGTPTPQEPTRQVTGQYLARNRLNASNRARLAARIIGGQVTIRSLTIRQTARLCRVSEPYVAAVRRHREPRRIWRSRLYVREHRHAHDVTLTALAKAIGKSPGLLSQIENGRCSPSLETLEDIAEIFGLAHAGMLFEPPGAERIEFARRVGADRFDAAIVPVIG